MKFDENLSSIHAYLCGDGYVIKHPPNIKRKYYKMGFRNTNIVLLKDFQRKFKRRFKLEPHIFKTERCYIANKEIYYHLTKNFSYYSYEWRMPRLSKNNLRHWLRSFYDCESWIYNKKAKNRHIGLECVNLYGLKQIKQGLYKFKISSSDIKIRKRKHGIIYRLSIFGLDNLKKFDKYIGYHHPNKKRNLKEAINSYTSYNWNIPFKKRDLSNFVNKKGRISHKRNEVRFYTIKLNNLIILRRILKRYKINSSIQGPSKNGNGNIYYILRFRFNHNKLKLGKF